MRYPYRDFFFADFSSTVAVSVKLPRLLLSKRQISKLHELLDAICTLIVLKGLGKLAEFKREFAPDVSVPDMVAESDGSQLLAN